MPPGGSGTCWSRDLGPGVDFTQNRGRKGSGSALWARHRLRVLHARFGVRRMEKSWRPSRGGQNREEQAPGILLGCPALPASRREHPSPGAGGEQPLPGVRQGHGATRRGAGAASSPAPDNAQISWALELSDTNCSSVGRAGELQKSLLAQGTHTWGQLWGWPGSSRFPNSFLGTPFHGWPGSRWEEAKRGMFGPSSLSIW